MAGLAERRASLPDNVTELPHGAPPLAHVTLQQILPLRAPRINLYVPDLNEVLLYDDNGVQIGILKKSSQLPNLSLIKFSSLPHLHSALSCLVRLFPILRSQPWDYPNDAGNVFYIYPKLNRGSSPNTLESVHLNELDNEPFI